MPTPRYTSETLRLKGGDVHLVYDDGSVICWAPTADLAADIAQALSMVAGVRVAMGALANGPAGAPMAARDVPVGKSWAFKEHRTCGEVLQFRGRR